MQRQLPDNVPLDPHFTPTYNPWDQRVCLVPDGDLFKALRSGKASVATDTIETFTENGIKLTSGAELEADVVVTATGLNLLALGGMEIAVDGREIALNDTIGYKGMMFSDIPNLAIALGYTNASWTLKCDLTCEYVCRLLNHMDANGFAQVTRATTTRASRRCPSSTSSRATSRAQSTSSRARESGPRGACTRTTRATSSC